jgi:hypothetical protein
MAVYLPASSFGSSYNPRSHAHQQCRILQQYITSIRIEAPDDGMDEGTEASRPTLDTEAFIHLIDEGEAFRLHRHYLPKEKGFNLKSPAHQACMLAHARVDSLNRAVSDALALDAGEERPRLVSKARINAVSGHHG